MDRRSAMEHQQFQRAQSTSRPADARQRGTSTGGGGSSFNPFSHSGQGTYSDPYQRAGVGGSISETVTATTVASDSDLAFLSGGGKPKYDVPVTHNPQYGVTSTSRGNANSGRTTSRAGSTGPLTIGTQRTSRFARSGAQGLASARQINSGGVFGNSGGGGGGGSGRRPSPMQGMGGMPGGGAGIPGGARNNVYAEADRAYELMKAMSPTNQARNRNPFGGEGGVGQSPRPSMNSIMTGGSGANVTAKNKREQVYEEKKRLRMMKMARGGGGVINQPPRQQQMQDQQAAQRLREIAAEKEALRRQHESMQRDEMAKQQEHAMLMQQYHHQQQSQQSQPQQRQYQQQHQHQQQQQQQRQPPSQQRQPPPQQHQQWQQHQQQHQQPSSYPSAANVGISSNSYASGADQNNGNVMTGRSTTRRLAPPGGHSSISFG